MTEMRKLSINITTLKTQFASLQEKIHTHLSFIIFPKLLSIIVTSKMWTRETRCTSFGSRSWLFWWSFLVPTGEPRLHRCPVKVLRAVDLANQIYTGIIPFIRGGQLQTSLRKDYCRSVQQMIPDPKLCKCMKKVVDGFAERQFDVVFTNIQSLFKGLGVELTNNTHLVSLIFLNCNISLFVFSCACNWLLVLICFCNMFSCLLLNKWMSCVVWACEIDLMVWAHPWARLFISCMI